MKIILLLLMLVRAESYWVNISGASVYLDSRRNLTLWSTGKDEGPRPYDEVGKSSKEYHLVSPEAGPVLLYIHLGLRAEELQDRLELRIFDVDTGRWQENTSTAVHHGDQSVSIALQLGTSEVYVVGYVDPVGTLPMFVILVVILALALCVITYLCSNLSHEILGIRSTLTACYEP
jgi:hypothetical protein